MIAPTATRSPRSLFFSGLSLVFMLMATRNGPTPPIRREATPETIRAFFKSKHKQVLTFIGYSGAGYEAEAHMLRQAKQVLARFNPKTTIVNIGATPDGIGAVYKLARQTGFYTTGIVSAQANKADVPLSPYVNAVFFVNDATWGGFLPGTQRLSPTSQAIIDNSDVLVAIGGGEVARDELTAAKAAGKRVEFIAADMNHRLAREKAAKKGQPAPTDFRGAAATIF
jgi:hypothetical protein